MDTSQDISRFRHEFRLQLEDYSQISDVLAHLLQAEGKAIRPKLFFYFCDFFGFADEQKYKIAAAIEYIHTASLLHDDIIDEAGERRGITTLHKKWDAKTAILVGDFLYSKAYEIMSSSGYDFISPLFARVASTLSISEINQLGAVQDIALLEDRQRYLKIAQDKTAILFAAACKVAVMMSENLAQSANSTASYNYGLNLGMAFQIMDDYLDYFATDDKWGKETMQDLAEGKITLPLIELYELADEQNRSLVRELILEPQQLKSSNTETKSKMFKVKEMMMTYKIGEIILARAEEFSNEALSYLTKIESGMEFDLSSDQTSKAKARDALVSVAQDLSKRKY